MNDRKLTVNIPGIGTVEASRTSPLPAHLRLLAGRVLSPRQDFWRRKDWPDDFNGQVFLGRAVQQMGLSTYGDEWTGYEPEAPEAAPPALGSMEFLVPDPVAKAALSDLYQYGGVAAPVRDRHAKTISYYDARHWEAAGQLRASVIDAIAPPISRFAGAVLALRNAMRSGALKYSLLIDETGEYTLPLPANYWNTVSYGNRFYFCKMHPLQPISDAVAGAGFRWLFVDAGDLAALTGANQVLAKAKGKTAFTKAYYDLVFSDPLTRKKNKDEAREWASADFGLGPGQFRDARQAALDRLAKDGVAHVYSTGGAPSVD